MMDTPIWDFVRDYAARDALRLHMPGHKGASVLGMEDRDITEIPGADSLYEAAGIIRQSEENASRLFGCPTFYSTEGSSQCIRAMLHLAVLDARKKGKEPRIAAGRNAHKTFLTAAALLDCDIVWIYPPEGGSYLSCPVTAGQVQQLLEREHPTAVYLTSPDYLGSMADIAAISAVCRQYGVLLLVDNAHGAYLRFLKPSRHPMDLGADLCCDSAHKTLPVLTGGAYLHIAPHTGLTPWAKSALALFGSTSPSYLILQSLDRVNPLLETLPDRLEAFLPHVEQVKGSLTAAGYTLYGDEPLKITLEAKSYGYTGVELAEILEKDNIFCEFADPDYLVLMLTPETGVEGLDRLETALLAIPRKPAILTPPPAFAPGKRICSPRQAMLSPMEELPAAQCLGRTLAAATLGCPPAVPIVVSGEQIDRHALECFHYYGITHCSVLL